jgi:hypothetical protein
MKRHKPFKSGLAWSLSTAVFMLAACTTATVPGEPSYKRNCTGAPRDWALEIAVDASGAPTEIVETATGNNADILIVCPGARISWELPGTTQFTIRFKRKPTPFPWPGQSRSSTPAAGKHELVDRVRANAAYDGYKYTVTVAGNSLDPMIIVDR